MGKNGRDVARPDAERVAHKQLGRVHLEGQGQAILSTVRVVEVGAYP